MSASSTAGKAPATSTAAPSTTNPMSDQTTDPPVDVPDKEQVENTTIGDNNTDTNQIEDEPDSPSVYLGDGTSTAMNEVPSLNMSEVLFPDVLNRECLVTLERLNPMEIVR